MKRRAGFTLIELVVVIMILGILAAVAAPKFLGTSATAGDSSARQTLAIVRDAIELYNAKYGVMPHLAASGAGAGDFNVDLAPYMRSTLPASPVGAAKNALIELSTANPLVGTATPTHGWKYNATTGQFIINSGAPSTSGPNYDTF